MPRSADPTARPSRESRRLPPLRCLLAIVATVVGALLAASDAPMPRSRAPDTLVPRPVPHFASVESVPYFSRSWVSPAGHAPSAHGSAICLLPSGNLFAVWYGGTREGATDVALYGARFTPGTVSWTEPAVIVDRALAESELDRRIKKVGNAIVFSDASGTLWMIYVSVSVGGWSGSALNVKTSRDEGRTWGESQRLTLNPFLNISSLVRNKPIYASDGRFGVPVYHEFAQKFPQMLWITPDPDGTVANYRVRNLSAKLDLIQPSLVPLDSDRVLMMLRDGSPRRRLRVAYSDDNGWTWSPAQASNLPNPDSAVDALRLRDGRIVLAYNHSERGRDNLRLAVSADEGLTWQLGPGIEAAGHKEFSYPHLAEDLSGRIHLTYTWHRERIRHVEFNTAWLDQDPDQAKRVAMAP